MDIWITWRILVDDMHVVLLTLTIQYFPTAFRYEDQLDAKSKKLRLTARGQKLSTSEVIQ